MISPEQRLKEIELLVRRLFDDYPNPKLVYHNLAHTQAVVKSVEEIASGYSLDTNDSQIMLLAAWLHDIGYLFVAPEIHEQKSAELAGEYLGKLEVDADTIEKVKSCILATKLPQSPKNLVEEILCDADLFYLGTDSFKETSKLMRKELELLTGAKIKGEQWREMNISFLESHQYFTEVAKGKLAQTKQEHLDAIKQKSEEKKADLAKEESEMKTIHNSMPDQQPAEKKRKKLKADRGVETMFRVTYANQMNLSGMADSKSNILISINSIIISVLISLFIHRLDEFPYLIAPTILFLACCLVTMTLAILSTRPNLGKRSSGQVPPKPRPTNLLFFGEFYNMPMDQYEQAMNEMIRDGQSLYDSLIKNIYLHGLVLERKYKLLRYAYTIFMYGFVISVVAFLIAAAFSPHLSRLVQ